MKNGIRIMNIEGVDAFKGIFGEGIKKEYNAVFSNSLLLDKLLKVGLKKSKVNTTRDIVNVKFKNGVTTEHSFLKDKEIIKEVREVIDNIHKEFSLEIPKNDKTLINADSIRVYLYNKGFNISFNKACSLKAKKGQYIENDGTYYKLIDFNSKTVIDKEKIEIDEVIHYKFWFRSSAKSRVGEVLFVNEKLYNEIIDWQRMNIPFPTGEEAMVVEMLAYMSLTSSSIEDRIKINTDSILVIDDIESTFKTMCSFVEVKEVNSKKQCKVNNKLAEIKNVLFDGQALIEDSLFYNYEEAGMMLLRHHFFKACAFRTYISKFYKDYCKEKGLDYKTYAVKDRYGNYIKVKDIKMITTENAMKWEKFFNNKAEGFKAWKKAVKEDNEIFGICKTDHASKLGDLQRTSYQQINSLVVNKDETKAIAKDTIDYVNLLKESDKEFIKYLKDNINEVNNNEMMLSLIENNKDFLKSDLYRTFKSKEILSFIKEVRKGRLRINGDNLTIVGNPYYMLQVTVLDKLPESDITLPALNKGVSVYTKRFEHNEELVAFRNPHNAPNNIQLLKNNRENLIDTYFNFSKNIIAANLIKTDWQDRLNGADQDSDFILTTNNKEIVKSVKENVFCKNNRYNTIVNKIPQMKKKYTNTLTNYAIIDNLLSKGKWDIGTTSNLAQVYLSEFANSSYKNNEYHDGVIILSVLAQVAIDNSKRQYDIDVAEEVKRLRLKEKRKVKVGDSIKEVEKTRRRPLFFYYIQKAQKNKAGEVKKKDKKDFINNIKCPVNFLQEIIKEDIGNMKKTNNKIELSSILTEIKGKAKKEQIDKIIKLVTGLDSKIKGHKAYIQDKGLTDEEEKEFKEILFNDELELQEDIVEIISKMKITEKTMNTLILRALKEKDDNKSASYIRLKLLNVLFKAKKSLFISQFKTATNKE